MSIVTLLTDFGTQDHYVACMKGVLLQIDARIVIVDITHEIRAHNVLQAAFVLRQAMPWFPAGTVHVAVVDPGVGGGRRILACRYGGHFVIAPDNGLVTLVHRDFRLEAARFVEPQHVSPAVPSSTFHGRDIMAPAAGLLARGVPIERLGPPADSLRLLDLPRPVLHPDNGIEGEVIYIDTFGNMITNLARDDLALTYRRRQNVQVYVGDRCIGPVRRTYEEVPPGEPVAVIGSTNFLEVAANQARAADLFDGRPGLRVRVA